MGAGFEAGFAVDGPGVSAGVCFLWEETGGGKDVSDARIVEFGATGEGLRNMIKATGGVFITADAEQESAGLEDRDERL